MPTSITACNSGCVLPQDTADKRRSRFTDVKVKALDPDENISIPINVDNFVRLLEQFMSDGRYNGFRVYFASYSSEANAVGVPDGQHGKLTILFVPTIGDPDDSAAPDDQDNWYHLFDGDMDPLPRPGSCPPDEDLVTIWRNNYIYDKLPRLEANGGTNFKDTRSLWYSKYSISGGTASSNEIGLIRLIKCGKTIPNPIVGLTVFFAAFLKDDVPRFPFNYQMTVTFNLHQQDDLKGFTFGSADVGLKDAFPADTGLPCPPNGNCPKTSP